MKTNGFKQERFRPRGLRTAIIGLSFLAAGYAAFACPVPNVFQDSFTELNPAFKTEDPSIVQVRDKKLALQPPEGKAAPRVYTNDIYDRVEICAKVSIAKPEDGIYGGLIFGAKNYASYYQLSISPAKGTAQVGRSWNGSWLFPIPAKEFAAVKRGPGEVNELRIAVDGPRTSVYINDQKFGTFLGDPPEGGGQVGVYGESQDKARGVWIFSDFGISKMRVSSNPPLPSGPAFEDNFATLQKGWTAAADIAEMLSVKDNKLVVQIPPGSGPQLLYGNDAHSSGEVRLKLAVDSCKDAEQCWGGVVFWAIGTSSYSFRISPLTGKAVIYRFSGGRYVAPVPEQDSPAIKKGIGETNELRLIFNGSQATAYINDQKFAAFNAQAPEDGGLIGFLFQSSNESPAAWSLAQFKYLR